MKRLPLMLLAVPLLLAGCVSENRPASCEEPSVRLELTLGADALTPSDPAVCRDQAVVLVVHSEVEGVLHIHGYDEAVPATQVTAGDDVELDFTAERSGQFPIELHTDESPEGTNVGVFTVHEP